MAERVRYALPIAVFMVIMKNDMVLMLKRSTTGWMDDMRSIPAGSLDEGEELSEAAKRECKEEVWLDTTDISLFHICHCNVHGKQWINVFYKANAWDGEPRLCEPHKHSQLGRFKHHELPEASIAYVKQAIELGSRDILNSSFGR